MFASPLAAPSPDAGWPLVFDADGCSAVVAGLEAVAPNRLGALLVAVAAPDAAGAELAAPVPENKEGAAVAVDVAPAPAVVVVAPLAAGVLLGAEAAGLPMVNKELPPVDAPVLDPTPANKLEAGAADDVGAGVFPPRPKDAMLEDGCEVAEAAGVVPMLKAGGLLAGVEEVVALG